MAKLINGPECQREFDNLPDSNTEGLNEVAEACRLVAHDLALPQATESWGLSYCVLAMDQAVVPRGPLDGDEPFPGQFWNISPGWNGKFGHFFMAQSGVHFPNLVYVIADRTVEMLQRDGNALDRPLCPLHRSGQTHRLVASFKDHQAVWICERSVEARAFPVGDLGTSRVQGTG